MNRPAARWLSMDPLLLSALVVAVAEIGDKTQILAVLLGARFRRPLLILSAILVATLANHGAAAAIGWWIQDVLAPETLRWALALSFLAMAAWALRPEDTDEPAPTVSGLGVFGICLTTFFLAEMGDKTQVATVAMTASFGSAAAVVLGSTAGMLAVNGPAVLLGAVAVDRLPIKWFKAGAVVLFVLLAVLVLTGGDTASPSWPSPAVE